MQMLAGGGMIKPQYLGVEGLAWQCSESVLYKLFVACKGGAFQDAVTTVGGIVEEGMSYMAHMGADLMCAAGLKADADK